VEGISECTDRWLENLSSIQPVIICISAVEPYHQFIWWAVDGKPSDAKPSGHSDSLTPMLLFLSWFHQRSGRTYLLLAVVIFASANSVTRKLNDLGAHYLIDGRNPISLCNVLFVGNLCALVALLLIYLPQLQRHVLRSLSWQDWIKLVGVAFLSGALAPALIFAALNQTSVNNVILIGRIEPPLGLVLSVIFLKARVNRWVVAGSLVSFVGVALTVLLQPPPVNMVRMAGFEIGVGDLMTAGGAIAAATGGVMSKAALQHIPLGVFSIVRTGLGTVIFFFLALKLYGSNHFMDLTSPLLWEWMVVYGSIIVVGGQLCWLAGLRRSNAAEISLANSFYPIAGILAAFVLLGETPTLAQCVGGLVILGGIALNQKGILSAMKATIKTRQMSFPDMMEMASAVGFKGI
jgi:drug/metabolite transporter (DMT)-like permease